jgi:hypothetical protein
MDTITDTEVIILDCTNTVILVGDLVGFTTITSEADLDALFGALDSDDE